MLQRFHEGLEDLADGRRLLQSMASCSGSWIIYLLCAWMRVPTSVGLHGDVVKCFSTSPSEDHWRVARRNVVFHKDSRSGQAAPRPGAARQC